MILIADSGSTKTDWISILPDGQQIVFQSKGINPATQKDINTLDMGDTLLEAISTAESIWFYGAGVANPVASERILTLLKSAGAKGNIHIDSDLTGAGRGICGIDNGIIGILGTGSNAGVYQSGMISYQKPSLGYILGDEGGAVHLGKVVLKSYFYGIMPDVDSKKFDEYYGLDKDTLLQNIYHKNMGSAYIASFATFLDEVDDIWKDNVLEQVFLQYIHTRIIPLHKNHPLSVSLTGSVAYIYRDIIRRLMEKEGIETGQIVQKPIQGLIDYHRKLK